MPLLTVASVPIAVPRRSRADWTMSLEQIEEQVKRYADSGITEVHLVEGGYIRQPR